jgi:uncharacterized protein (DUF2249 family)
MSLATVPINTLDVRAIAPRHRHALILASVDALRDGETLELVNDHDPQPLRSQLQSRASGSFEWSTQEGGPDAWRVHITKRQDSHGSNGTCCGSCGGA